jgi:hypothetical protein
MQLMAGMHSSTSLVVAKWVSFNSAEDVEEASRQRLRSTASLCGGYLAKAWRWGAAPIRGQGGVTGNLDTARRKRVRFGLSAYR